MRKHEMKRGMIGILWNRENHSVTESNFKSLPISIEEKFFENECLIRGYPELPDYIKKNEVLFVSEVHLTKIRQILLHITQSNLENKTVYHLIEDKLVDLLFSCLTSTMPTNVSMDLTYSKFANVIDYIHQNIAELTSVNQICLNRKVSERTLRLLIRKKYQLSPKNYINTLRLNEVRKNLKNDSELSNVRQIASEFNFWHMGQFSRDYKKLFGELPSETIRNHTV